MWRNLNMISRFCQFWLLEELWLQNLQLLSKSKGVNQIYFPRRFEAELAQ